MPAGIIAVNIALKSTYQTFKIMFSHYPLNCNPSQLISIPDKLANKNGWVSTVLHVSMCYS